MNHKKANWIYLSIVLFSFAIQGLILAIYYFGHIYFEIGIVANLLISQMMLLAPTAVFALTSLRCTRTGRLNELFGFHKIKISTCFMVILFTVLLMPMTTALNAISMFFVDNAVNEISGVVLQMPFPVMLFLIGMFGPFSEELVFRGVIFRGYKNSGPVFWSIFWSAVLFGLMHMNFNQAAYAIPVGIMFALLVEVTGSLWSSVIAHMIFNMPTVCTLYLSDYINSDAYAVQSSDETMREYLLMAIGPWLIVAVISTALAFCVLDWLAKNERRECALRCIWDSRKDKGGAFVSIPLIIAIVLSLAYMILEWILTLIMRM